MSLRPELKTVVVESPRTWSHPRFAREVALELVDGYENNKYLPNLPAPTFAPPPTKAETELPNFVPSAIERRRKILEDEKRKAQEKEEKMAPLTYFWLKTFTTGQFVPYSAIADVATYLQDDCKWSDELVQEFKSRSRLSVRQRAQQPAFLAT